MTIASQSIVIRTLEERIASIDARRKQLKTDLSEHLNAAAHARETLLAFDKQVGELRLAIARQMGHEEMSK